MTVTIDVQRSTLLSDHFQEGREVGKMREARTAAIEVADQVGISESDREKLALFSLQDLRGFRRAVLERRWDDVHAILGRHGEQG